MRTRHLGFFIAVCVTAGCATSNKAGTVAVLPTGEWYAVSVDGRPAIPADTAQRPSIQFFSDSNHVAGSTGCNRFAGPYTASGSSLTFGSLAVTRMACADSAVNAQELAFTAALGAITSFAMSADTLTLLAAGSPRLRFVH
jgi:heat shock protein HslJ